ncbi:sulfotransferase [Acidiphilium sp. AL]|uniref:tetratricopeptide repeat-containing sulfotransferase family protein n=1 Tax=Acidiphilium sp. AL TaxID=2871704 RepID=UPI0021CAEA7D|nr:tetratricopeptide repeat-containing sulfotransferase family protein [Acidiphilium sp. AL]MCU4161993.1 sulfotransferase [Acidiphilium sp. AL]
MSRTAHAQEAFDAAIDAFSAGHYAEAERRFRALLEEDSDDANTLRLYGLALAKSGKPDRALAFLARARRLSWQEPLAHLHHGVGLLQAGQPARAAAVLRRAAQMAPQEPASWINLAAALIVLDRIAAARSCARRAVAVAPEMPEAHYTLGLTNLAAGTLPAAQQSFDRAIELKPEFSDAWLNRGVCLYRLGDVYAAGQAFHRAIAANPGNSSAASNLAALMLLGGETDEALTRLRNVVGHDPDCIPARLNLANALLFEGCSAEVLSLLNDQPPPGRAGHHWRAHRAAAFIGLGRWDDARAELDGIVGAFDDSELLLLWRRIALALHDGDRDVAEILAIRMEEIAALENMSIPEHRIIAYFDLARFHHVRGDKRKAFAHWTNGHHILARFQPYDRESVRAFTDASIAAYSANRIAGLRADNADPAPVFIVGMPRSGTTLAEQILAAHPQVYGAGERSALHRLVAALAGSTGTAASVERLASLDVDTLSREATKFLEGLYALKSNETYVIDKLPGNAAYLGFIATLLPAAKIIHCRRDPRDIGLSIYQLRFFGYHPYAHDLGDLGFAIAEHERLMAHWRIVLEPNLLELDLVDWIRDFSGTLDRVLDFLALPFDPACEHFYRQTRRVRTASAAQVREPINARGIGRYRDYAEFLGPLIEELDRASLF